MPNPPSPTIHELEIKREQLKEQIAQIGDMRLGILSESYRKCGKPTCHCAREGDPGHGPLFQLYRRDQDQKAIGRAIPAKFVEQTREQVDECHRFRKLSHKLMEVSEQICDQRLQESRGSASEPIKKNSRNRSRP